MTNGKNERITYQKPHDEAQKSIESLKQIVYALANACMVSGLDVTSSEDLLCSSAREWAAIQRMKR